MLIGIHSLQMSKHAPIPQSPAIGKTGNIPEAKNKIFYSTVLNSKGLSQTSVQLPRIIQTPLNANSIDTEVAPFGKTSHVPLPAEINSVMVFVNIYEPYNPDPHARLIPLNPLSVSVGDHLPFPWEQPSSPSEPAITT